MKPSSCIFQVEGLPVEKRFEKKKKKVLPFFNWKKKKKKWCQKFTTFDLIPIIWPSSRLKEHQTDQSFLFILFYFDTGTHESEWSFISPALIFLCETNKKKSALFPPDLAVTRAFSHTDFSLVHQSACFVNVLQWTVFVSPLGEGGGKGKGGGVKKKRSLKALSSPIVISTQSVQQSFDQRVPKCSLRGRGPPQNDPLIMLSKDESQYSILCYPPPTNGIIVSVRRIREALPGLELCDVIARWDHINLLMQTLHQGRRGSTLRQKGGAGSEGREHKVKVNVIVFFNYFFSFSGFHDYCISPLSQCFKRPLWKSRSASTCRSDGE